MILLLILLLLLVHCGSGESQEPLGSQGAMTPLSPVVSPLSEANPGQEVKERAGCCDTGTFYTTKYFANFMETDVGQQIREDYMMFYCVGSNLINFILGPEDAKAICQCDCEHSHGASKSELACDTAAKPCACIYSDADEIKFQSCKRNEDDPLPGMDQPPPILEDIDSGTEVRNKLEGERTALCKLLFGDIGTTLICDPIKLANGDPFYTFDDNGILTKLFPEDICALDCSVNHGVTEEPYGSCCTANDGTTYCRCAKQ